MGAPPAWLYLGGMWAAVILPVLLHEVWAARQERRRPLWRARVLSKMGTTSDAAMRARLESGYFTHADLLAVVGNPAASPETLRLVLLKRRSGGEILARVLAHASCDESVLYAAVAWGRTDRESLVRILMMSAASDRVVRAAAGALARSEGRGDGGVASAVRAVLAPGEAARCLDRILTAEDDLVAFHRLLRNVNDALDEASRARAYWRLAEEVGIEAVWAAELERVGSVDRMTAAVRASMQEQSAEPLRPEPGAGSEAGNGSGAGWPVG